MNLLKKTILVGASLAAVPFFSVSLLAHCDSYDGPIIPVAQEALRTGDIQPVLKWVEPEHEAELREAFARARKVTKEAPAAKDLIELWFLETFVRIHREGEGAAYTGLKPSGSMDPFYMEADVALEKGSVDKLAKKAGKEVTDEITTRFAKAKKLKESADESVDAGREYVEAYVEYMHFIEELHALLSGEMGHYHD